MLILIYVQLISDYVARLLSDGVDQSLALLIIFNRQTEHASIIDL